MARPWGSRTPGFNVTNTRAFMPVAPSALTMRALWPARPLTASFTKWKPLRSIECDIGAVLCPAWGGFDGRRLGFRHFRRAVRLGRQLLRLVRSRRQGPVGAGRIVRAGRG